MKKKQKKLFQNLGLAAFLFFLGKGLLWLGAFAFMAWGC